MKENFVEEMTELSRWLGYPLTEEKAEKLKTITSLQNMREKNFMGKPNQEARRQIDNFFRKGTIGDWKNHDLDGEKFDAWIEENLKGTDIDRKYVF